MLLCEESAWSPVRTNVNGQRAAKPSAAAKGSASFGRRIDDIQLFRRFWQACDYGTWMQFNVATQGSIGDEHRGTTHTDLEGSPVIAVGNASQ